MKKLVISIIVVIALAGAYFVYLSFQNVQSASASVIEYQTAAIQKGSLVATISATGRVRPGQTAALPWKTSGTVEKVSVEVGSLVKAGERLAQLEQTSLPKEIILAQSDLVSAQKALDNLYTDAQNAEVKALQNIAAYAKTVKDAQYQLDNYTVSSEQAGMSAIEGLDMTEEKLDAARTAFEPYKFASSNDPRREELLEDLNLAQSDYNAAVKRLEYEYELQVAQANLDQARQDYETWKDGPEPQDIKAAEAKIAAAQATLNQAWIEAPIDGTITAVDTQPGDQASANSKAFRIDDLSNLLVDLQVSEIDVNKIQVGQAVTLTFDAIPARAYHGAVSEVGMVGEVSSNLVDYTITVRLNDADAAVRPSMTSEVKIVVSEQAQALLAPNQAIQFVDGQPVIYILRSGQTAPVAVEITLGAVSDIHSEILQGEVQAGDQVVLNMPEAESSEQELRGPFGMLTGRRPAGDEAAPGGAPAGGGQP